MLQWLKKTFSGKNAAQENDATNFRVTQSAYPRETQSAATAATQSGDQALADNRTDEAIRHYREAIAIDPKFATAHCGLGDALRQQKKLGEAAQCYRAALEQAPGLAQAHFGLGVTLLERADAKNALVYFQNAVRLQPDFANAHNALGFACMELGAPADALAAFRRTVSLEPENGMALHLIASLTGSNPEHAPRQYVEKLFDGFASTFDTHLQQLQYDTPERLVNLLLSHAAGGTAPWSVLDLGCGTGLVGVRIARYANQLAGVDLSAKMLDKARERGLYHRLAQSDLVSMMAEEPDACCDVIISADTFIYVGKLDDVAMQAARLLRTGGWFAFSVEALTSTVQGDNSKPHTADYLLQPAPSCRYAHSFSYLQRLADEYGFVIRQWQAKPIRTSNGTPVDGYLVLMEKITAPASPASQNSGNCPFTAPGTRNRVVSSVALRSMRSRSS